MLYVYDDFHRQEFITGIVRCQSIGDIDISGNYVYDKRMAKKRKQISLEQSIQEQLVKAWGQRVATCGRVSFTQFCGEIVEKGLAVDEVLRDAPATTTAIEFAEEEMAHDG